MARRMRFGLAWLVVLAGLGLIALAFWQQDVRYLLPTPRPVGLVQPVAGTSVWLPAELALYRGKPLLLHFFNPQCPCSRFNLPHVRDLQARYKNLQVVAILQSESATEAMAARERLDFMPAIWDSAGTIAAQFGVYSTPQAVVLTPTGQLHYRGNYNRTRYCSDSATAYAQHAVEGMLRQSRKKPLPVQATIAYGCPLPRDVRADTTWLDQFLN